MNAVARRARETVAMTAAAVWHGTHDDGDRLRAWMADLTGAPKHLPEHQLAGMLQAHRSGKRVVRLADVLKEMGRQ